MRQMMRIGLACMASLLALAAPPAWAITNTWDGGGGNTSWNTALNWSNDRTPESTNAYTLSSSTPNTTLDADFTIQKLTYSSAGSLAGGTGAPHTLTLNNGSGGTVLDLNPGGAVYTISNTVNIALGTNSVFNQGNTGNAGSLVNINGVISGPGCTLTKTGQGAIVLNGLNTYDGPTYINGGALVFTNTAALGGSGQNVTIAAGAALGFGGQALTQAMLTERITSVSSGMVAMGSSTAANLDFTGLPLRLGAITNATFTGTLTPNGSVYRVGSMTGILTIPATNAFVDGGSPRSLDVDVSLWAYIIPGVVISNANAYSGGTTLKGRGYSGFDLEVGSPAALGSGTVTVTAAGLYYNVPGSTEITVTNDFVLSGQAGLQWNQTTYFTGRFTLPSGSELFFNRNGNNSTIIGLPALSTQAGKLTVGRGMLDLSNTNQLPKGAFDAAADQGMTLLNNVSWAQFCAARTNGYGSGNGQWQSSAAFRMAARGTPVVIDTASIPGFNPTTYADGGGAKVYSYFDRIVTLGSTLTRNGQLYVDQPVTMTANTILTARRAWLSLCTGPGLYGSHTSGVVSRIQGNITDSSRQGLSTNRGCLAQFMGNCAGELVLAGTNDWTATAYTDDMGTPMRAFSAGPGGLATGRQVSDRTWVRFDGAQSLPRGTGTNTAYLAAVGKDVAGYLVTARPVDETYELFPLFKFALGGTAGAVLGSSGLPGWSATLVGADVATHNVTNGNSSGSLIVYLPVRGGKFTLGSAAKPVSFIPTYGMEAANGDPGLTAAATTLYDATLVTCKFVKVNSGTLILGNIAYTDLAKTANKAPQYNWQIGSARGQNQGPGRYSDGAVRGLADGDPLAGNSNSLKNLNINLRGGVYEVDGRGSPSTFTRSVGTATNQVQWVADGGGGFAAFNGPLAVNLNGDGSTQTWGSFVPINNALIFGSETANDAVSLVNTVSLNNAVREICVLDNTNSASDYAILAGPLIGGGGNGALTKAGPGTLVLAASNSYAGATAVTNGTLLINGVLDSQSSAVTVYSGATLGGTGLCMRPVTVATGGTAVISGTYTKAVSVAAGGILGGTGTLAASNLTFSAGAVLQVTLLDTAGHSQALNVTGAFNATNVTLQVVNTNLLTLGQIYPVVTCTSHTNTFAGSNLPSDWIIDYRYPDRIQLRSSGYPGTLLKFE